MFWVMECSTGNAFGMVYGFGYGHGFGSCAGYWYWYGMGKLCRIKEEEGGRCRDGMALV